MECSLPRIYLWVLSHKNMLKASKTFITLCFNTKSYFSFPLQFQVINQSQSTPVSSIGFFPLFLSGICMSIGQWMEGLEFGHDWYFSTESNVLIVPNGRESENERSLLPSDWLKSGVTTPESFKSPNKRPRITAMEPEDEFNLGNSDASRHGHGLLYGQPDYQLQNLCESIKGSGSIERMDDLFLNSLLEEDSPDVESPYRPVGIFLDSECISTPVENLLSGFLLDSRGIKKNSSCMGSSKYLKTSHFPIAMGDASDDTNKKEDGPPSASGTTEGSPTVKAPALTVSIPSELKSSYKDDAHSKEESLEAAVLQELNDTMSQLNQNTRICFRDALYRLAKSSDQQHSVDQSNTELIEKEPSTASVQKERPRYSITKPESETNAIDRTIMNLLFQELNYGPQIFHGSAPNTCVM